MKYCRDTVVHGFRLTRARHEDELSADIYEFVHERSGASLVWLDSGDENKLFSVTFRTLPENDTGVFHILEHSVLNGSDRYPVHEPFVELLKSSMNTYLNAMTFPDKTMYPVSSRNTRDFMNLSSVYLDAVFCPTILHDPNIFYQEGIHIEPTGEGREAIYKGVVFNEMKGATSSPESVIGDRLQRELYPDNCYKWNSGGDPVYIPELTYEKYIETYKRFYHPSNAIFFLDGDIPFEELLELIDSRYLCNYEKSDRIFTIEEQQPLPSRTIENFYELPRNEELEGKNIITFAKLLCRWDDRLKISAANIICDYLTASNESPLKRAMLDEELCEDISLYVMDGTAQPAFAIEIQNTSETDAAKLSRVIQRTIRTLLDEGLDKRAIEACINVIEFSRRELKEPKALFHAINAMNSLLYGGDPLMYLVHKENFALLREMLAGNGFEELIEELFLRNDNLLTLITKPSYEYGDELRREENERVMAAVNAMSDEEFESLKELNSRLVTWQQSPDSPEALATIPVLELSELDPLPENIPTEIIDLNGSSVIFHKLSCSGIIYISLSFKLSDLTVEELADINFASSMFGDLPTENYSVLDLQTEIKLCTGRLNMAVDTVSNINDPTECMPMFTVSFSVLPEKLEDARRLILEILRTTDFTQTDRIHEAVTQEDYYGKRSIESAGHAAAMTRANAHFCSSDALCDAMAGIGSVRRLHDFAENFDDRISGFTGNVNKLLPRLCRERLIISVTADELPELESFVSAFPNGASVPAFTHYSLEKPMNEGFTIASQISFVGFAATPYTFGKSAHGSGAVLSHILSLNYLWNSIRVQGGAYGAGCSIRNTATIRGYTYRDPAPVSSISVLKAIPDYIRSFADSGEQLDKYIISTVSDSDPLRAPMRKGRDATALYLAGASYERQCKMRTEMLGTNHKDLLDWADYIENSFNDAAFCVIGFGDAMKDAPGFTIEEL